MIIKRLELHNAISIPGEISVKNIFVNVEGEVTNLGVTMPLKNGDEVLFPWPAVKYVTRPRAASKAAPKPANG